MGGKRPQKKIKLPDGWWLRLCAIVQSKWEHNENSIRAMSAEEIYTFTAIGRRTFSTARKLDEMTEALFARLTSEIGYDDPDELLRDLSGDVGTETGDHDEPIPVEIKAQIKQAEALIEEEKHGPAIPILTDALAKSDALANVGAQVECRLKLADALYRSREDYRAAETMFREALAIVPDQSNLLQPRVLFGLGQMLSMAGNLNEARSVSQRLERLAEQSKSEKEIAWSLQLKGVVEQALGFNSDANATFDTAIGLLLQIGTPLSGQEKKQNAANIATCYLNKATIAKHDGYIEDALSYCEKAAEHHLISGERLHVGRAHIMVGELYAAQAQLDDSYQSFMRAMAEFVEIEHSLWMARTAERLARSC